jgi:amidohydrolase
MGYEQVVRMAGTGVVALLQSSADKPWIALRADLDALPIQELNQKEYKSKNDGVMHACGHDAHTATMLSVAGILISLREKLSVNIKFIFQPGEEKLPGGASLMIQEGVLKNPAVTVVFGLHVSPEMPTGKMGYCPGPFMASTDELYLTVIGKGGHAAMPERYVSPLLVAADILKRFEDIRKERNTNPAKPEFVIAFGKMKADGATNVIPEMAFLEGTLRCFDEELRAELHQIIQDEATAIANQYGATCKVDIHKGYPVLVNHPQLTERSVEVLKSIFEDEQLIKLPRRTTAEDFAFYSHHVPVCFLRWGTGNSSKNITAMNHHPEFDIDEEAFQYSIAAILALVLVINAN